MAKLVRDKIPDIIRNSNRTPQTHISDKEEYWKELKNKLKEEVNEFLEEESTEELADISEVLNAIYEHKGISGEEVERIRKKKREERGGFEKGIIWEN